MQRERTSAVEKRMRYYIRQGRQGLSDGLRRVWDKGKGLLTVRGRNLEYSGPKRLITSPERPKASAEGGQYF